ncbi:hypothetical protein [Amycolatopsis sp.]|uniref:hypothetical protein n=1 Tax=Amycolatopsis sp. TaxID=37632 RepID=UPI002C963B3B|nr:hypothetical protein [Amycolatopsis sp.]HVV08997.1 hypothetical protein [Amycolatopsis sp.]
MTDAGEDTVHVKLDETAAQLNRLSAAAQDFNAAWQAAAADCNPTGKLGNGPMGKAFQPTIATAAKAAEPIASVPVFYQRQSDNGRTALQQYQNGEAEVIMVFNQDK